MPPSVNKYHSDWLSLIEVSGPFISIPVLSEVFPQGLEDVPLELVRSLRADLEFWQENSADPAVHSAWIRLVLESLLGYGKEVLLTGQAIPGGLKAEFPEHEETLRPDFVLAEPSQSGKERKPRLLIQVFPPTQDLDNAVRGSKWVATVGTRMMELLHATEVRLGLATNGEQWMLVDAPRGETTGFITWYASLWFDERATLNAFQSLLGLRRFFGVSDDEALESLLARSADNQWEVTDQLGLQVRHAVEILIQSLDRADQNRGRKLLGAEVSPDLLYEAALTVMMRLVFMLSAEERKLLPIDDDQYSNFYAASTLREQLENVASQYGEEVLERRYDAWSRLLAVFRAVYGGIEHQDLHLPAYGGGLFDPDRYPFLEGRAPETKWQETPANPLPIDNRTVLHLLDSLQMLRVDGEMRRLSFRALDVEQIGHVYEGLLDHHAVRASEVVLGFSGAKKMEPEIALSTVEQARKRGETALIDFLKDETQKSPAAIRNALGNNVEEDALRLGKLRSACANDDALLKRVLPFAGLIRMDDFGNPVVILPGSVYVTEGTTRRATGTHYTPRSLTEPIVQHTLEPLVYEGVAEGWPREKWRLRSPAELLELKICDMAMGSAGFLVQVVRYLAERLIESWSADHGELDPENRLLSGLGMLSSEEDRLNYARRLVAEHCIYGVDKNPLAVEIAKLSLWLVTLAKEKPFTFLNHALRPGDSLVGTSVDEFLRWANRKKKPEMSLDQEVLSRTLSEARRLRKELESFVVLDLRDAQQKQAMLLEADAAMEHVKRGADLLAGVKLLGLDAQEAEDRQVRMIDSFLAGLLDRDVDAKKHPDPASALSVAKKERAFHWEFEFPEVFENGGFSAFVGNPPFIGGKRIREMLGDNIREALYVLYPGSAGGADIVSFFFLRGYSLINRTGTLGLIATNTIAQGDTRQTGLERIAADGGQIYRATNNAPWPGTAAVFVSIVFVSKGHFSPPYCLDDRPVEGITSFLDAEKKELAVHELTANAGKSFIGSFINGMGFILEAEDAKELLRRNPANKAVIFPYLIGDDLNSDFRQTPSRWVINFFDWPLERAEKFIEPMKIVREKVFPVREHVNRVAHKKYWWQYGDKRPALYKSIRNLSRVLVQSRHTKYLNPVFVRPDIVFSDALTVFPTSSFGEFCIIQSSIHEVWARRRSGSIGTTLRYTPSDCLVTFPFPKVSERLEETGKAYHELRRKIMDSKEEGLTETYNHFHDPAEKDNEIARLRSLHIEMDCAVAAAYGWNDLDLDHGFHETPQGVRFTINDAARREILARLLKLNHERWEAEQAEGEEPAAPAQKKGKASKSTKKAKSTSDGQLGLL